MQMARRLASAVVVLGALAVILFVFPEGPGRVGLGLFMSIVLTLGAWEALTLHAAGGLLGYRAFGTAAAAAFSLASFLPRHVSFLPGWLASDSGALAAILAVLVVSLGIGIVRGDVERGWTRASVTAITFTYVAVLGSFWVRMREDLGVRYLAEALALSWNVDTCAMIVGHSVGRTKLSPRISPNKTVEGFFGGMAAASLIGCALKWVVPSLPGSYLFVVVLCVSFTFVTHAGDLSESLLKRWAGVKDSSDLIPGHGGFLDKLDALLFVGPFYYFIAKAFLVT